VKLLKFVLKNQKLRTKLKMIINIINLNSLFITNDYD